MMFWVKVACSVHVMSSVPFVAHVHLRFGYGRTRSRTPAGWRHREQKLQEKQWNSVEALAEVARAACGGASSSRYHKVRLTYRRYMFGYVRLYVWICKVICDGKWVNCP